MLPRFRNQADSEKLLQANLTEFNSQFNNDPFDLLSKIPADEYWRFFVEAIRQDSDVLINNIVRAAYEAETKRRSTKENHLFPTNFSEADFLKMPLGKVIERNKDELGEGRIFYFKKLIGKDFQHKKDYYLNLTFAELLKNEKGWVPFERREKNYLKGVVKAFCHTMEKIKHNKFSPDLDLIKSIHLQATSNVQDTNYEDYEHLKGEFRPGFNDKSICSYVGIGLGSSNSSQDGLDELAENIRNGYFWVEGSGGVKICLLNNGVNNLHDHSLLPENEYNVIKDTHTCLFDTYCSNKSKNKIVLAGDYNHLYTKGYDSVAILNKVIQTLIDRYQVDFKNCNTPLEKIYTIVKRVLHCEQVHPFNDANCRTLCMVLLNALLIENKFPPVILDDVMKFHGHSVAELTHDVVIGMQRTLKVAKRVKNIFYYTTDYLEQELNSMDEKVYFKEVVDIAKPLAKQIQFNMENYYIENQSNINTIAAIGARFIKNGPYRDLTQEDVDHISDLLSKSGSTFSFIQNPQLDGWQIDIILSFLKYIKINNNYEENLVYFNKIMNASCWFAEIEKITDVCAEINSIINAPITYITNQILVLSLNAIREMELFLTKNPEMKYEQMISICHILNLFLIKFLSSDHSSQEINHLHADIAELAATPLGKLLINLNQVLSSSEFEKMSFDRQYQTVRQCLETYKEPLLVKQEQQKPKYEHDWFVKESNDILAMLREVVAQEFFRLLLSTHPKTHLITNNDKDKKYTISKEINGFRPLSDKDLQKQLGGNIVIKYIGEICVLSVLLNEVDLQLANIGVDANGNAIKIDVGCCFARLRLDSQQDNAGAQKMNHEIPEDILDMLPIPGKYSPWNWLTVIKEGVYEPNPPIFNHKLSNLPTFRLDVNKALLKILILPDELLYQFVSTYYEMGKGLVDDDVLAKEIELTYQEIITRRNKFKELALKNDSFKEYINSDSASVLTERYAYDVEDFKTTQKSTFLITDLKEKMEDQLEALQYGMNNKPSIKM